MRLAVVILCLWGVSGRNGQTTVNTTSDQDKDVTSPHNHDNFSVGFEDGSSENASPESGSSENGSSENGSSENGSSENGSSENGSSENGTDKFFCTEPLEVDCWIRGSDEGSQSGETGTTVDTFRIYINLIVWPALSVFGCICNVISIFVLTRPAMKNPFNSYLLSLSTTDLAFLLVGLVRWAFWLLSWLDLELYRITISSFKYRIIDSLLNHGFGRLSNVLVLVLSVERFIAVRFPLRARFSPFYRHPWRVIIITAALIFVILIPNQFTFEWKVIFDSETNTTRIIYGYTDFRNENPYLFRAYTYFLLFTLRFVPVFFVLFFNMGIILTLVLYKNSEIRSQSTSKSTRDTEQLKMTRILIAVSVLFLVCITPGFVHFFVTNIYSEYKSGGKYHEIWTFVYTLYTVLDIINSTLNIFIYLLGSRQFRTMFLQSFGCDKLNPKGSDRSSTKRYQVSNTNTTTDAVL